MRNKGSKIFKLLFVLYLAALCFCCFWNFSGGLDLGGEWFGIHKDKVIHRILGLLPEGPDGLLESEKAGEEA